MADSLVCKDGDLFRIRKTQKCKHRLKRTQSHHNSPASATQTKRHPSQFNKARQNKYAGQTIIKSHGQNAHKQLVDDHDHKYNVLCQKLQDRVRPMTTQSTLCREISCPRSSSLECVNALNGPSRISRNQAAITADLRRGVTSSQHALGQDPLRFICDEHEYS